MDTERYEYREVWIQRGLVAVTNGFFLFNKNVVFLPFLKSLFSNKKHFVLKKNVFVCFVWPDAFFQSLFVAVPYRVLKNRSVCFYRAAAAFKRFVSRAALSFFFKLFCRFG